MRVFLKVKIKSLAAESSIIRREAAIRKNRFGGQDAGFKSLQEHRRFDVRNESRSASLAYGFLRGRPYKAMEAKCWTQPDWSRVEKLAIKYGGETSQEIKQRFQQWKDGE